jgi:protein O-GlcNAc transferase
MDFTLDHAMRQGINAHKAGRLELAEKFYRAVLGAVPGHPDANHNLGVLIAGRGAPNMAIPHFKSAIMANPNRAQFWISYVDSLIKVGKTEQAGTELETARRLGLKDASFALLSDAIARIEEAIEPPHDILEELFVAQKGGDSATVLEKATGLLEKFPKSAILLDVIGGVYLKQEDFEKALKWFEKEIARSPDSAAGFYGKGEVFFAMADYERAGTCYEEAIARNPNSGSAFHKLGNVCLQAGDKDNG